MARELRLLFQGRRSALVLKTLIFGFFLALVWVGGFSLTLSIFFIIAATAVYGSPSLNNFKYLASFLVILFSALFLSSRAAQGWASFLVFAAFILLFYLILGLKNLFLVYREKWHYLLVFCLIYALLLIFFLADKSSFFIFKIAALFLAIFFLAKEFFRNSSPFSTVFAWITAFLAIELIWAISFLPIGFLSSANLSLISIFLIIDTLRRHIQGTLSRYAILVNLTIFVFLTILVLAGSSWSI